MIVQIRTIISLSGNYGVFVQVFHESIILLSSFQDQVDCLGNVLKCYYNVTFPNNLRLLLLIIVLGWDMFCQKFSLVA